MEGACYTDRLDVNCRINFVSNRDRKACTSMLETQSLQKTQPLLADVQESEYFVDMMLAAVFVGV